MFLAAIYMHIIKKYFDAVPVGGVMTIMNFSK